MQTVILDLSRKNIIPPVHAKQGDVGRKFKAVLTDAGMTYAIPRGAQFSVWYSGASGEGNYSAIGDTSAFTVEENVVTVELITQMLTNAGTCSACLVMHGADGSQLGLWNIVVVVEPVPGMGSEAAEQHYTALSEVAEKAVKAAETFQTDTTLNVSGRAADAAAVGTALDGKAPSGYGLGTTAKGCDDCNTLLDTGFYQLSDATLNKPSGQEFVYGLMLNIRRKDYMIVQIVYGVAGSNAIATRQIYGWSSGTWGEWEYVNPPMYLGVEYRTTERWDGKAVYTKLIEFGTFPNQTSKRIACEVSGENVFYSDAYAAPSNGYVPFSGGSLVINGSIAAWYAIDSSGVIWLTTNQDLSTYSGYIKIKYIKP